LQVQAQYSTQYQAGQSIGNEGCPGEFKVLGLHHQSDAIAANTTQTTTKEYEEKVDHGKMVVRCWLFVARFQPLNQATPGGNEQQTTSNEQLSKKNPD
jgi:hypothetical protein